MTFLLRIVAECREIKRVVIINVPRQLARIERSGDLILNWHKKGLREREILAALRVKSRKER